VVAYFPGASDGRAIKVGLVALLALALLLSGLMANGQGDATAATKYSQPGCAKLKAKIGKTTGKRKRAAKAAHKQCAANMTVYKQVRNSHFVGYRADDVKVDTIYCGTGKWQDDATTGGRVGDQGWRIVDAKVSKDGKRLTATVEAWIPGGRHVQALARNGDQWQVGWEWNGEGKDLGDVEKRDARAACAGL
jgi:hypothetical protein